MYGIKIKKNIKSPSYRLSINSQHICTIQEKDLINDYEDFLEDPMNPSGILIYVLNSIDKAKKDHWAIDKYADVKLIRQEVILEITELFERINNKDFQTDENLNEEIPYGADNQKDISETSEQLELK